MIPPVPLMYGYIIGLIIPCIAWAFCLWRYPKHRKEILTLSLILGVTSPVSQYFWWSQDWWYPPNLTNTIVGVEDVILGIVAGSMGVLYEVVLQLQHVHIPLKLQRWQPNAFVILFFVVCLLTAILIEYYDFSSFQAAIISLSVGAAVLLYFRPDLVRNALMSAVFVSFSSLAGYIPILLFAPGWIEATYRLEYLSGSLLLGIPVEEFIFWFFAGLFFGPFYEYWKQERLRSSPSRSEQGLALLFKPFLYIGRFLRS